VFRGTVIIKANSFTEHIQPFGIYNIELEAFSLRDETEFHYTFLDEACRHIRNPDLTSWSATDVIHPRPSSSTNFLI